MMRKIVAAVLVALGIVTLVAATAALIQHRLALPPSWSVETEGRWVAYGLREWAFMLGELPLSLALLLGGILLWPSRPHSLVAKGQGILSFVIALVGLVGLARTAYSWLGIELSPSLAYVLLGIVINFVPLLAITVLAAVVAVRRLSISESAKKPYEAA